ncbi:MAG: 1-deoxy-D-xylulose-5-phosphate synthase [Verrucomicrobiota bacterium]|nr:1-deoxy-D-xylulose-5-phosphate synthase [Verrucomicrobiota bacterium]
MARFLDRINSPDDVKKLNLDELEILCEEIRQELIVTLSKTGGHLGPNLGVVELTVALHYIFNSPVDKILMDVSHQAYVHKILTGRVKQLHTIRQYKGLNGFMLRTESPHDCYGAGHAGTALSAALGMATARDLKRSGEHIICLAGDAAFTCGVTFEALNNITVSTKRLIVILNDNEWSIAKNVGAIANYFNKIVTNPHYEHLHDKAKQFLERVGGKGLVNLANKAEEAVKSVILPSVIFEELGLRYYGPMDGHDLPQLVKTLEFLKHQDEPVLLHVLTKKGKGYQPAIDRPDKFHGLGAYNLETGETKSSPTPTYSELFGNYLAKFAAENPKICAITGAMPTGTGLVSYQKVIAERYFDVGIAEEHAVLFAAGLATQGFRPVVGIYSTFLQRAFDMIVHDVALQNLNVIFCMDRAGLSGDDGPTHHGLFDIAYMRCIPNMIVMAPKDEDEFVDMLYTSTEYAVGPLAMRYPRGSGTGVLPKDKPSLIPIGKAEVLQGFKPENKGKKVAIFGYGHLVSMAEEAAGLLEKSGFSCAVINGRFVKPLDKENLEQFAGQADAVLTLEDHVLPGGYGSAVMEGLQELGINVPVFRVGWPDEFIEHGNIPVLREKHGISAEHGVKLVCAYFEASPIATRKVHVNV